MHTASSYVTIVNIICIATEDNLEVCVHPQYNIMAGLDMCEKVLVVGFVSFYICQLQCLLFIQCHDKTVRLLCT